MISQKRGKILAVKGKKGGIVHEQFFNIFEIALAILILLALLKFIYDISNKTIFEKNYMARDLAILLNTLYSAPGEVRYDYSENIEGLVFDFAGNKVEILTKKDEESTKVFYPFGKNKNLQFLDKELIYENEKVKIIFLKSKELLNIAKPDLSNVDLASSKQTQTNVKST